MTGLWWTRRGRRRTKAPGDDLHYLCRAATCLHAITNLGGWSPDFQVEGETHSREEGLNLITTITEYAPVIFRYQSFSPRFTVLVRTGSGEEEIFAAYTRYFSDKQPVWKVSCNDSAWVMRPSVQAAVHDLVERFEADLPTVETRVRREQFSQQQRELAAHRRVQQAAIQRREVALARILGSPSDH